MKSKVQKLPSAVSFCQSASWRMVNSWFRCGSAYTSNSICEFINQTKALLPAHIKQFFFRADSGFFNGALLDLLESFNWTYLVTVKLENLKQLLESQTWQTLPDNPFPNMNMPAIAAT